MENDFKLIGLLLRNELTYKIKVTKSNYGVIEWLQKRISQKKVISKTLKSLFTVLI